MHISYQERLGRLPDFEVTYQLFSAEEGGRKTPAYQGIRWDFMYDEYRNGLYMVYPEILDLTTGKPFESGLPIPECGKATMWILSPEFRPLHRQRIKAGIRGYFMEGFQKVGVCEVTKIIGLFDNPISMVPKA